MLTELEYVRGKLSATTPAEWEECSKVTGVPFTTIKKIAYRQVLAPRSDNTGKIATYFRTMRRQPKKRAA